MDWDQFFERTRVAAGVDSFAKLAPKLGVTDGAKRNRPPSRLADTQQARTRKEWVTSGWVVNSGQRQPGREQAPGSGHFARSAGGALVGEERTRAHHCPCVGGGAPYTPARD